jgi:hypothetical protein
MSELNLLTYADDIELSRGSRHPVFTAIRFGSPTLSSRLADRVRRRLDLK